MAVVFSNNAKTTLASSASTSATSISVADGSVFPALSGSDYAYVTFEDTSGNVEIVKVTALSSNTLTVVRAQDNTSARAFSAGDKCELRVTAGGLNEVAATGGLTWIYAATMPTTAVPNSGYLAAGGQSTLMPLNPDEGTIVAFSDLNDEFDTNPLTLNGNGQTFFQGTDVQYILDLKGTFAEFSFLNGYWRLINFGRLSDAYGFGAGGSSETQAKIRLTSTEDASTTSTGHAFQIGDSGDPHLKMDRNELAAYNGTSTSSLHINNDGGNVTMGNVGGSSLLVKGNITATSNITSLNHIFVGTATGSYIALQPTSTGAAGVKIRTGSGDFSIDLMSTINDFHIREDTTVRYTFLKNGNFTATGTVNGRDIATDGTKLDGIEASADVTDSTNVVAALTAGTNITIAADGTISSSGGGGGGGAFTGGTISGSDVTLATGIELITQTAGSNNFRAGVDAGSSITSGSSNVFVGDESGKANTTAGANSAFGYRALKSNTTGSNNSAFGHSTLEANSTGFANIAVGKEVLKANTTGQNNIGIGYRALYSSVSGSSNSAFGYESLLFNTTGGGNVAVGYRTLKFNTTGISNVAFGGSALENNTTGNYNTAVGKSALQSNTSAGYGTAFGYFALGNNTTGINNIAFGINALKNNTTGQHNSSAGAGALVNNTSGRFNSAYGSGTLESNTTADNNSAFGYQSLKYNTTGFENSATGRESLYSNVSGSQNSAYGMRALRYNSTGSKNTSSGYASLYTNSSGSENTATGHQSGYSLTTGDNNSFYGRWSGYSITTGSKNLILGKFSGNQYGIDIRTSNNNIVLSDGDGNPRLHIDGAGAATFSGDLDITGTTTGAGYLYLSSKTANQGLRLNNTTKIQAWNPAGTVLRSLMQLDANEDVRIGSSANPIYLDNDTTVSGNLATTGDVTIENSTPILDITYTGTSGRIDFNNSSDAVKSRIIYTEGTGLKIGANGTAAAITIADGTNNVSVSGGIISGAATAAYASTFAKDLILGDVNRGTHTGMTIVSPTNKVGTIRFTSDTTDLFAGYVQYHHTHDSMTIGANSTPRLIVDASGLEVVGTIRNSTAPATYAHSAAANLVVGNSGGNGGLTIASSAAAAASIHFARGSAGTDQYAGYLNYVHSTDTMGLGVSAGTKFTMTTTDAQFFTNNLTKLWGSAVDVSITRGNSSSGSVNIYRNNGQVPWSIVGGQAGVTLDLELDYNGSLRGDFNSTTGAYTALSLRKFKDNIEDVVDPFEIIRRLRPRTYNMSGVETAGYIYDEVDGVLDIASMDTGINHRPIGVNHDVINTYTTAAVQRLIVASEAAAEEIAQLKADIQELRGLLT